MSGLRWWWLAFLGAFVLLASAGGFLVLQAQNTAAAPKPPPPPRVRCPNLDAPIPALLPGAESPPVMVGVGPGARLLLDGKPAATGPLPPGEHTLRAEADGSEALALTFRLDPFRPALFHAEVTPGVGLTLVWLGAACHSCPQALDAVRLDHTRTSAADADLLADAAKALRANDWRTAAARLRAVTPKSRAQNPYRRLAAHVYQATRQPAAAQAELERVERLTPSVAEFSAAVAADAAREAVVGMQRWNLLTEKFSHLLEQFAADAPGAVQQATGRLAELTAAFLEASRKQDFLAQDELVKAAEEAFAQFVRALRRSRPDDCDFQARVSASL